MDWIILWACSHFEVEKFSQVSWYYFHSLPFLCWLWEVKAKLSFQCWHFWHTMNSPGNCVDKSFMPFSLTVENKWRGSKKISNSYTWKTFKVFETFLIQHFMLLTAFSLPENLWKVMKIPWKFSTAQSYQKEIFMLFILKNQFSNDTLHTCSECEWSGETFSTSGQKKFQKHHIKTFSLYISLT